MFIVFKKSPSWYKFWKNAEYSIAPFDSDRSISDSSSDNYNVDRSVYNSDIGYSNLPVFMIRVIANLDVDSDTHLKLVANLDCNLME